jgi:short-subunit dehydrogenase involved in D-alanine esterification of teichoic acids
MEISNNKVLITGGSSGIGLALAIKFINLGNEVIITGRDRDKLKHIAKYHSVHTFCCDLNQEAEINELVNAVKDQFPDLNVLINNAGIQYNYSFLDPVSFSLINEEIGLNLSAMVKLCGVFAPLLVGPRKAAIVNISSSLAISPKKSAPVYSATKAGVHHFTKALRYQLNKSNIKVFEVIPPVVDTPMTQGRGISKISVQEFVEGFINGFDRDVYEMKIGRAKLLNILHRISPLLVDNMLKDN